jgi:hypothetical protein
MRFFQKVRSDAGKQMHSRLFRISALVLAWVVAALVFVWPLARRNSAQDFPVTSKQADEFVLVRGADGEIVCREALPEERAGLDQIGSENLRQINHLEDNAPTAPGEMSDLPAHLTIILRATAQLDGNPTAKNAFIAAAANWENRIKSPVTIYIDVDYGPTNFGAAWPAGVLGSTSAANAVSAPYLTVRSNLQLSASNANETTIYNSLPSPVLPTDTGDVNTVSVPAAIARAIGLLDPTAQPTDSAARIGFNSTITTYDFTPPAINSGQTDFDAVATHEIGHALGFSSRAGTAGTGPITPAMWDLYRFRAGTTAGTFSTALRIMTIGGPAGNNLQYFFAPTAPELGLSTGGPSGSTSNNGDGRQSSHWKSSSACDGDLALIGIMDPAIPSSCRRSISTNDMLAANILGYNLESNVAPPPAPTPPPAPANDNFTNAQPIGGCNGTMIGSNVSATKR